MPSTCKDGERHRGEKGSDKCVKLLSITWHCVVHLKHFSVYLKVLKYTQRFEISAANLKAAITSKLPNNFKKGQSAGRSENDSRMNSSLFIGRTSCNLWCSYPCSPTAAPSFNHSCCIYAKSLLAAAQTDDYGLCHFLPPCYISFTSSKWHLADKLKWSLICKHCTHAP